MKEGAYIKVYIKHLQKGLHFLQKLLEIEN